MFITPNRICSFDIIIGFFFLPLPAIFYICCCNSVTLQTRMRIICRCRCECMIQTEHGATHRCVQLNISAAVLICLIELIWGIGMFLITTKQHTHWHTTKWDTKVKIVGCQTRLYKYRLYIYLYSFISWWRYKNINKKSCKTTNKFIVFFLD